MFAEIVFSSDGLTRRSDGGYTYFTDKYVARSEFYQQILTLKKAGPFISN